MKTLHLYLTRQILATVLMTVAVFTFVLLLGNMLKDIVDLLIHQQASLFTVAKAIGLLIPFVLLFSLPMGMLTATLLVFGRFSADQELTAVRASGISLISLVTPVLLLAVVFSGLCAWINLQIAPQCRVAYKALLYQVVNANPNTLLRERQYNEFPGGYSIYIHKINGNEFRDVKVYKVSEDENSLRLVTAPTGKFIVENNQFKLTLFNASDTEVQGANVIPTSQWESVDIPLPKLEGNASPRLGITEMTFTQLQAQLRKIERSFSVVQKAGTNTPVDLRAELKRFAKVRSDITMPVKVQIHRQIAFSFACIGFTLIGIPLGIRAHRRETSIGIALSLLLVLVYYSFIILAQAWDTRAEFTPHLITWAPNFLFQIIGGVLLWRANKGIN